MKTKRVKKRHILQRGDRGRVMVLHKSFKEMNNLEIGNYLTYYLTEEKDMLVSAKELEFPNDYFDESVTLKIGQYKVGRIKKGNAEIKYFVINVPKLFMVNNGMEIGDEMMIYDCLDDNGTYLPFFLVKKYIEKE